MLLTLSCFILAILSFVLIFFFSRRIRQSKSLSHLRVVAVVVLGDVLRCPRMTNHVRLLAAQGFTVLYFAYNEETATQGPLDPMLIHPDLKHFKQTIFYIPIPNSNKTIKGRGKLLYVLSALYSAVGRTIALLTVLLNPTLSRADAIENDSSSTTPGTLTSLNPGLFLVQNPPSIPTLAIVAAVAFFRNAAFVIDWHNLGYSIMQSTKAPAFMVSLAKLWELNLGRLAHDHFCVSNAMASFLYTFLKRKPHVLYDCPPSDFTPTDPETRQELFRRLELSYPLEPSAARPFIIVTSTSWTPDEDFAILLDAMKSLDTSLRDSDQRVLLYITGKGPLKAVFEEQIRVYPWTHVQIQTIWLQVQDYPRLLGSADIGISMHVSSSGLDLPMKVVDMLGCGLPVLSIDYPCIAELVQVNVVGRLFTDSNQLANQLLFFLNDGASSSPTLQRMKRNVIQRYAGEASRWEHVWKQDALLVFEKYTRPSTTCPDSQTHGT